MDSSSTPSSERRHSVPNTYYGKYRGRSPGYEEKITRDQCIQTDKLPSISDGQSQHSSIKYRRSCGHSHSKRKRFKRINHGELIDMLLKNEQVKLKEKYKKSSPCKKQNGNRDKREKSDSSFNDIQKLERQISHLFSSNSKDNSKYLSENGSGKFLPNIEATNYSRVSYSLDSNKHDEDLQEALLQLQDGGEVAWERQIFDMHEQQEGDDNTEEFLICLNDNEKLRSCVLQSLNDKYSRALSSTRSSSDYWSSYNATDGTVSTISLQSSSPYLEDLRKRSTSEIEERANVPKSPRLFPLVVDAESVLSEPVQSGYIPSAQMKLISVHFLDSDSDNNIPSKTLAFRDPPYPIKPTYETKENVVIFELDDERDENIHSTSQQSYNNTANKSKPSDIKQVPENKSYPITKYSSNLSSSSVVDPKKFFFEKSSTPYKNNIDLDCNSCSCASAVSSVVPKRDMTYGTPVNSRLSSIQKSYSTLVNASNKHVNYASDSTDDDVSNPDSLDGMSFKQKGSRKDFYNKHDEKIVRGDASCLAMDKGPKKKHFSYTPYFITLNGDEIYSLHHLKYKLPEEIKRKLMTREKKLRKHSREKCKHCSKASLLKKILRKKQHLKLKHQMKQAVENRIEENEKNYCSRFCGHMDRKTDTRKKQEDCFEKHTCSNTIVVHEIKRNRPFEKCNDESESFRKCKDPEDLPQEKSLPTVRKQSTQTHSTLRDRKTRLIRNHCTQTSMEEGYRELCETMEQTTNTDNIELVDQRPSKRVENRRHEKSKEQNEKFEKNKIITSDKSELLKNQENDFKEHKNYPKESKKVPETIAIDSGTPDTLDTSQKNSPKKSPVQSQRVDDDVDKAIMYILLDGLMQSEKESLKREKKSIAVQVKSPETYKSTTPAEADMQWRLMNPKYERKFDIIPEEDSAHNNSDFCGSPLDYNDKIQPMKPMYKSNVEPIRSTPHETVSREINTYKQCRCTEEMKQPAKNTFQVEDTQVNKIRDSQFNKTNIEDVKYDDSLLNKRNSLFSSIEESHPLLREKPKEIPQRKYSSVSNISIESLDLINPPIRRHKSNGSIPPVLNYKSAMMIGTFTPFSQQKEGSKGKKALTVGEQEELLSKGWINFYLLKGGDSHEFFSDADDEYIFMPNFDLNEPLTREKDTPVESIDVEVKSKPESVLPIIPNKTNKQPEKQPTKPKRGPLPKLNVKPKKEPFKNSVKKDGAHKNCFLENSEINNPKTKRFSQVPDSRRMRSPKNKPRQSLKPQKTDETAKPIEPAVKEIEGPNLLLGTPDTPCDSFVSQPIVGDFEDHKENDNTKELDHIVKDYDGSIQTVSSLSARSDSDESQKQIVQQFSKPERDRSFQSQHSQRMPSQQPSATSKPCSEHNWKVTVASEKSNAKQSRPNIELHLSMNSTDQSRERRRSKPRHGNKMNLSLTLKNFCGDSDASSSSRQENFYDKDKTYPDPSNDPYAKERYKNLTHADDTGSIRSSTAMSYHEELNDKEDITSSKRNTIATEEGILSVTGSYITPELRRKPPTMSEKDLSLYKNSKK